MARRGGRRRLQFRAARSRTPTTVSPAPGRPSDEVVAQLEWQTYTYEGVATNDGIGAQHLPRTPDRPARCRRVLDRRRQRDRKSRQPPSSSSRTAISKATMSGDPRLTSGARSEPTAAMAKRSSSRIQTIRATSASTSFQPARPRTSTTSSETTFASSASRWSWATPTAFSSASGGSAESTIAQHPPLLQLPAAHPCPRHARTVWGTPGLPNSKCESPMPDRFSPALRHFTGRPRSGSRRQPSASMLPIRRRDWQSQAFLFDQWTAPSRTRRCRWVPTVASALTSPARVPAAWCSFYVRGQDSSGATTFLPADATSGGAFYKVQDNLSHTAGRASQLPHHHGRIRSPVSCSSTPTG